MQVGGFIYPFSEFATFKDQLLSRLGYQDDTGPWTMKGTAYDTGLSLLPGPLVPRCANFSRTAFAPSDTAAISGKTASALTPVG